MIAQCLMISEVTVYKKVDIHNIFDKEKASACVGAPQPAGVMSFDSRVTHLTVSCDDTMLAVVTDDNKISLVDVRTLNSDPAVFSQASLSAKCKCMIMKVWKISLSFLLCIIIFVSTLTFINNGNDKSELSSVDALTDCSVQLI